MVIDQQIVRRLISGDWSFGHDGQHHGIGTVGCPIELHHHCDEFCRQPTREELFAANINPKDFKVRKRTNGN